MSHALALADEIEDRMLADLIERMAIQIDRDFTEPKA